MRSKSIPIPLEGKALLNKLKQLEGKNKTEKAKVCGYYSTTKDGNQRAKLSEFMEAILEAQGIVLEPEQRRWDEAVRRPIMSQFIIMGSLSLAHPIPGKWA